MTDFLLAFLAALPTGVFLPLPEEAVVLGLAAAHPESTGLVALGLGAFAGLAVRDFLLFLVGRVLGARVFRLPLLRRVLGSGPVDGVTPEHAVRAVVAARFAFGVKAGAQVTLGALGVPVLTHGVVNLTVLAVWVAVWVVAGTWFREPAEALLGWMGENQTLLVAMGCIVALAWATRRFASEDDDEVAAPA